MGVHSELKSAIHSRALPPPTPPPRTRLVLQALQAGCSCSSTAMASQQAAGHGRHEVASTCGSQLWCGRRAPHERQWRWAHQLAQRGWPTAGELLAQAAGRPWRPAQQTAWRCMLLLLLHCLARHRWRAAEVSSQWACHGISWEPPCLCGNTEGQRAAHAVASVTPSCHTHLRLSSNLSRSSSQSVYLCNARFMLGAEPLFDGACKPADKTVRTPPLQPLHLVCKPVTQSTSQCNRKLQATAGQVCSKCGAKCPAQLRAAPGTARNPFIQPSA